MISQDSLDLDRWLSSIDGGKMNIAVGRRILSRDKTKRSLGNLTKSGTFRSKRAEGVVNPREKHLYERLSKQKLEFTTQSGQDRDHKMDLLVVGSRLHFTLLNWG